MLYRESINAVRWVGGPDIELVSMATNSKIVPRFSMLDSSKLGTCSSMKVISLGVTGDDQCLIFEDCPNSKTVSVVLYASNKQLSEEIDRSFHDAICVVRNMIKHPKVLYGGASSEFRAAQHIKDLIDNRQTFQNTEQEVCGRAFAAALSKLGLYLAENAPGQESALDHVARVQAAIKQCNNSEWIGIDALGNGCNDMKQSRVLENARQKLQQLKLSSELVRQFIKIDSIRTVDYGQ
ncbi:MAG: T-complex protein 1 subunit epsilon [Marteilia pararefringens]